MSGEKTEKPTAKKLREARKEGRVARTNDLSTWLGVLAASFVIPLTASRATDKIRQLSIDSLAEISDPQPADAARLLRTGLGDIASLVGPLSLSIIAVAVMSTASQGGLPIATKKLKPDFKHLNPIGGLKRMFGPQGAWEATKSLLKVTILALVVWHAAQGIKPLLGHGNVLPLSGVLRIVASTALTAMREAALAGLVLAGADFAIVKKRIDKGLRMSKQDIKDEHKQADGDPQMKGKIKQRQMEMSRNRMMAEVQSADVVIVNPTHVAVALRYDPAKGAPRVVAKGKGVVAAKIRALAEEHRVPMVQDVPLARALHKAVDIGGEVPPELYNAVARVLAFIMSLKARGSAAGVHRVPVVAARR
ncbi:flagellar biosynthetic protein FlhB [Motilibacter peucedani]|uniref:Flagellar biosynthetic protein FlhB n=1 Tax=Motilibacter peucedani TaxID=598650 RepID=A0A420XTF6_9ACTN|nr:EscU/YscU/HrcU family type III secretion system export apparatus switch protein [Motilibacter peucedani]RKS80116.1 flagellar biosynthetic protein FlhB [Motilibacter peucedani]